MIYTVANKADTDKRLAEKAAEGGRLFKQGMSARGQRTPGGAVWETRESAQRWLDDKLLEAQAEVDRQTGTWMPQKNLDELKCLAVYRVEGDWERDAIQYDGEPYRRLIIDRPMAAIPVTLRLGSSMSDAQPGEEAWIDVGGGAQEKYRVEAPIRAGQAVCAGDEGVRPWE
jgi:hypothetical protein